MSFFDKWTGPAFVGCLTIVGASTIVAAGWQFEQPIGGGYLQRSLEKQFDGALTITDLSIETWAAAFWFAFGETSKGAIVGKDNWLFTDEEYQDDKGFQVRLESSLQEVIDTTDSLESNGFKVIIALLPDKARVLNDRLNIPRSPAVEQRYDYALDTLNGAGLDVADLRLIFSNAQEAAFFKTDTHWTPYGAKIVAEAIGQQARPFTTETTEFETIMTGAVLHQGDLMTFLPLPGSANSELWAEPLVTFETTQITDNDLITDALFGSAEPLGALIGTSFSANENWHFNDWLRQFIGLDIVNYADEGTGPFEPMRKFLNSEQAMNNTTSGLIIWEIPERYLSILSD